MSAAWERPAPDRPVITTNSFTCQLRSDGHPVGVLRERGDGQRLAATSSRSRGMVAASVYSGARARKPGGGAGSSIRSTQQARARPWRSRSG